jgi:hypothetical protein
VHFKFFFSVGNLFKQILAAVRKKIIAFVSDGALVMIGKGNGDATKFKNKMKNSWDRHFP